MIKFYIPHSENLYTFQNTTLKYLITVAKTCEKDLRLNMTSTTKVEKSYNKTVIDFNFGRYP